MDPAWLSATGRWSLYLYFGVVTASLIALLLRVAFRRSETVVEEPRRRSALRDRFVRFVVEYFGNLDSDDLAQGRVLQAVDRRQNRQARFLMDYIEQELTGRGATSSESEEVIEGLRKAIRSEGPGQTG